MSQEIFDAIADFLQYCGMNSTLAVFQSERVSVPPLEEITKMRNDATSDFKQELLNSLTTGDIVRFHSLWGSKWPAAPDQMAQRLLFLCEVFFAVFPVHPANRVRFGELSESLARFRTFLDTHQQDLSQSTEFLPFYALPYIPNPAEHPSFRQIFTIDWFNDLKRRLSDWLDRQLSTAQQPLLVTALRSPQEQAVSTDADLWSAALELADALQHAINGDMPSRERVYALFQRIGIYPGGAVKFTATTDYSPLDFRKVFADLCLNNQKGDSSAAPLLKAMVNRLTRAPADAVRRFYIELIEGDVLGIIASNSKNASKDASKDPSRKSSSGKTGDKHTAQKLLPAIFKAGDPALAYLLRLMNVLATDSPGRQYLWRERGLLGLLVPILAQEDSGDVMNAVGILQKLSLLKDAKRAMIEAGVLEAALKLLSDPSALSSYTSDYTAVLVMNLCRRPEAAPRCLKSNALQVLSELSGTQSTQLQLYANETLSYLLSVSAELREAAKASGLPLQFEQMKKGADANVVEQLDFLVRVIAGEAKAEIKDDADDDDAGGESFDAYDEVGDEQWEFDMEGEALLAKYVITGGEAQTAKEVIDKGLRMSQARMSVSLNGQKASGRRPVTPGMDGPMMTVS